MTQLDDSSQGNLCKVISSLKRQMWVQTITQVFADKPLMEEIHNGFCNSGFGLLVFLFFLFISLCCGRWNSCHAIILLSCDNFTINLVVPSKFLALSVFITELTFFSVSRDEAYRVYGLFRRNRTFFARKDTCFMLACGRARQVQCQCSWMQIVCGSSLTISIC